MQVKLILNRMEKKMEAKYNFTDKDKEWLAYELGMPLDEIEATIDDIEYVDKHGLNKKIFGL